MAFGRIRCSAHEQTNPQRIILRPCVNWRQTKSGKRTGPNRHGELLFEPELDCQELYRRMRLIGRRNVAAAYFVGGFTTVAAVALFVVVVLVTVTFVPESTRFVRFVESLIGGSVTGRVAAATRFVFKLGLARRSASFFSKASRLPPS